METFPRVFGKEHATGLTPPPQPQLTGDMPLNAAGADLSKKKTQPLQGNAQYATMPQKITEGPFSIHIRGYGEFPSWQREEGAGRSKINRQITQTRTHTHTPSLSQSSGAMWGWSDMSTRECTRTQRHKDGLCFLNSATLLQRQPSAARIPGGRYRAAVRICPAPRHSNLSTPP